MRIVTLLFLIFTTSCATKYLVPGNRFITAESKGGFAKGDIEINQSTHQVLQVDVSQNTVTEGVVYHSARPTGYKVESSLFNSFDFIWNHVAGGNSMVGGKLQVYGGSRTEKATGHKVAFAALFGGNKHETDDKSIEFELQGKELMALYAFRYSEMLLLYAGAGVSTYTFHATIASTNPALNGQKPSYRTDVKALNGGLEFQYLWFVSKLECAYQKIDTSHTNIKSQVITGFSLGYAW